MSKRLVVGIAGAIMAISLIGASGAAAATEFGDNCVADAGGEAAGPTTLFALTAAGDPLPLTAPSSGVITNWKFNLTPEVGEGTTPQTLQVLRQTGPLSVQVIGESTQSVAAGANSFDTRIPVQAGDRLAFFAPAKTSLFYCAAPAKNRIGAFEGAANIGSSTTFKELEQEMRLPAFAVLEPDADNDGYGDETQDKCPQSAAAQAAPCPVVTVAPIALSTTSTVKKTLANVLVTTNSQAPVTVTGTVKLGKGKSAKLSGGTQIVVPGVISRFTLLFPEKLKSKLKQLSRKQFLWLNLAATASNSAGAISTSNLKVKLKGQAKPEPKPKPKHQA